jgi:hypothetical protein
MRDKREVELQQLAEKATPGPWECREVEGLAAIAHPKGFILESDDEQEVADKRYIAAASPDYILQLLTKISQLEQQAEEATQLISDLSIYAPGNEEGEYTDLWASINEVLQRRVSRQESAAEGGRG